MRYAIAAAFLLLAATFQASVFSRFALGPAAPQLLLLSVLAWSLARGPAAGMLWGFGGGLFYDLASGGPVGVSALAMLLAALLAGAAGGRLFGSNPLLPMLAVFAATLLYFVVAAFLLATLHYRTDWAAAMLDVALPGAAVNAALSLIVYPVFSFVAAHTNRRQRVGF